MLNWYINEEIARLNGQLSEAEARRRVHVRLDAGGTHVSIHGGTMLWLGDRLVALGQRMQERYDVPQVAQTRRVYMLTPAGSSTTASGEPSPEKRFTVEKAA